MDNWIPISRLGSGSFGHVELALSLHDGSLFAVKSCSSPAGSTASAQLLNEIAVLQSLSLSPHVVRCLGSNIQRGQIYLEFMDGGSLRDAIKRSSGGCLPEPVAVRYTQSIVSALHHLHQTAQVVHGDVKSHNVLLSSAGAAKLADFGAAHHCSQPAARGGTPLWMAPEVAQGLEQGPASDIWSLGCTLMEMLQGGLPWLQDATSQNPAATLFKIACSAEDPPLPPQITQSCSAEAQDFLRQCLRRDPDARPRAAQLLHHPFLQRHSSAADNVNHAVSSASAVKINIYTIAQQQRQLQSPRSTLCGPQFSSDSLNSSAGSSFEQQQLLLSGAAQSPAGTMKSSTDPPPAPGNWITVKRAQGWTESNMNAQSASQPGHSNAAGWQLEVKRACEVRLDSIAFLRNINRRSART